METNECAIWLGKWFAHHYAPWVSEFNMKELETYELPDEDSLTQDQCVGLLPHLWWTFHRFRILEDEWRSPSFCSPVRYVSISQAMILMPLEFWLGLRRFRYKIVSTLHTHAIRIFHITDVLTLDDRWMSQQITALGKENAFLYAQGDSGPMERYLRSDSIATGGCFTGYV